MKIVIAAIMAALISGIGVGFQGTFNALLQRNIGLVGLICWVHFVGFVVSIPLVIIYQPNLIRQIIEFKQAGVPFFVLFSGVFGLIIVPGIAFSIEKLNPAIALAILMLGQTPDLNVHPAIRSARSHTRKHFYDASVRYTTNYFRGRPVLHTLIAEIIFGLESGVQVCNV